VRKFTWNSPHGPVELKCGEIHLWQADVDRNLKALEPLEETLGPQELARAGQFRVELDRNRYIVAHGVLRTILARYLEMAPGELVFRYGPQGKPELATGNVRFNMSHSHDLVLCAISRTCDVGVDVERVRPGVEEDVVRCFSPGAVRSLEGLPPSARRRAFYQSWTRMEAYAKGCGEGLKSNLANFDGFLNLSDPGLLPTFEGAEQVSRWWFHDFRPRRGYVGALAAGQGKCRFKYWKWQAHEGEE
jgi:4'-phosphopantetheinyl transferase